MARKKIPLRKQLNVALRQLGIDPDRAELDHDPALGRRLITDTGGYEPAEDDERYLVWRDKSDHLVKTRTDVKEIAKTKRLIAKQQRHLDKLSAKAMKYGDEREQDD